MLIDDSTIYANPNPYGYKLNINHPLIRPHYERFKVKCNTPILSDAERFEFERLMIDAIEKNRKKQKKSLPD